MLCLLCIVQVAASANSRSLAQKSPTVRVCLIVCDLEISTTSWAVAPQKNTEVFG